MSKALKEARMQEEDQEAIADPLHEARERFKEAKDAWDDDRKRYVEDMKFLQGEHWPDRVKEMREMQDRPCLVVDKLNQYVKQVVNDSRQNRPSIKVRPVDSDADIETADIIQGMCRHVEERSNADTAYDTAIESAVKGGFGFIRVLTEYAHEMTFDQELCIKRVRNPLTVFLDPNCQEPDGSDARYAFVTEELPEDEYEREFPDADKVDWMSEEKYSYWYGEKKVRVAEYWWIETEDKTVHLLEDGTTCTDEEYKAAEAEGIVPPPIKDSRVIPAKVVKWAKINGADYLEEPRTWPGKWIPVVPVWGNEVDIDGKVIHTSMIHTSKDAQRLYDYSRSAFAERVALTPKAPYVAADGQIEAYEDDWSRANSENIAVLKYTPVDVAGTPVPPPQRQSAADIPAGFAQDMQMSEHDIQGALGMYNASLGQQSNEKSGRAILARQREGDVANFHYHDNLARAIRHVGRILVDLIPKIYDSTRIVRTLGLDGTSEMVQLDPTLPVPSGKVNGVKVYNVGMGTYDVAVSAGPSYTTRRQEAAESMTQLVQGNPALMGIIGDLMIRAMDWPQAEEIADRLKLMLPPQVLEAEKEESGGPSPEVQAMMQQAQQAMAQKDEVMQGAVQKIQELMQENQSLKVAAEQANLKAQKTEIVAAQNILNLNQKLASAELDSQEQKAIAHVTQMAQSEPVEPPEPIEQPEPQLDIAAILQAVASMQQPQPPINITVPVTVDGKGQTVKQGRAVRQADGSYIMESVETPIEAE